MSTRVAAAPHPATNLPLKRTLTPCACCGATVLVRVWHMGEGKTPGSWEELTQPLTPVFSATHQCTDNPRRGDRP